jgi:glucan phosphoethanolaminetransferase (alkaline phosphatase superfamily)
MSERHVPRDSTGKRSVVELIVAALLGVIYVLLLKGGFIIAVIAFGPDTPPVANVAITWVAALVASAIVLIPSLLERRPGIKIVAYFSSLAALVYFYAIYPDLPFPYEILFSLLHWGPTLAMVGMLGAPLLLSLAVHKLASLRASREGLNNMAE